MYVQFRHKDLVFLRTEFDRPAESQGYLRPLSEQLSNSFLELVRFAMDPQLCCGENA